MAYTGLQLSQDIDTRTMQGQAGAFMDKFTKDHLVKKAALNILESNYKTSIIQGSIDEISPLIKTYQEYTVNNNQVLLKPLSIVSVSSYSNTTYLVYFDRPHNLIAGTFISISGVTGGTSAVNNPNAGQSYYTNYVVNDERNITITVPSAPGGGATSTPNTGILSCPQNFIVSDYYHFLQVQSTHRELLNSNIKSVLINSKVTIITIGTNNIANKEYLYFKTFNGTTLANGFYYVKKINGFQIKLYSDKNLTNEVIITGTYTGGGEIYRQYFRGCEPLVSDQKIGFYNATPLFPLYETNNNRLRVYTSDINSDTNISQLKYTIDYVTVQAQIDLEDNIIDLLQTYNFNACMKIVELVNDMFIKVTEDELGAKINQA
jgi:hypothetical protein